MIFFERSQPAPDSLALEKQKKSGTYRTDEVIERVSVDFKDKCYICEYKKPISINVEHFVPHKGNRDLMFDWNNLFLSCAHCNNTKLDDYDTILNCTNPEDEVESRIDYAIKEWPEFEVVITAKTNDDRTALTVKLINAVYMGTTPEKRKESGYIRDTIAKEFLEFRKSLLQYRDESLPVDERQKAKEAICEHLNSASAFTAFKRAYVKRNAELSRLFGAAQ
jgi:uncharacterized protein (TIGR02646 family)